MLYVLFEYFKSVFFCVSCRKNLCILFGGIAIFAAYLFINPKVLRL